MKKSYYIHHRAERLAYQKKYNAEHKGKIKEINHKYYMAHREKQMQYVADWQKRNPDKTKIYREKQYARQRAMRKAARAKRAKL